MSLQDEQIVSRAQWHQEGMSVPALPDDRLGSVSSGNQESKCNFKNQVVEAIRISYELAKKAVDREGLGGCMFYFIFSQLEPFSPSHLAWTHLVLESRCGELTKGGHHGQNQRVRTLQGMEEPTNLHRALRHSRSVEANPPLIQARGPMYHHVPHAFGRSPLFTLSQMGLSPPWQQAPPDSSNSREPYYPAPDMHYAQMASSRRFAITELPIVSLLVVPTRVTTAGRAYSLLLISLF